MRTSILAILVILAALLATGALSAQPKLVKDIHPKGSAVGDAVITPVGEIVYFRAHDGTGFDLWRSDGTGAGTYKVPLPSTMTYVGPSVELGGRLLFAGKTAAAGTELFSTDGTVAGTKLVKDIRTGIFDSNPNGFGRVGNIIYFTARDAGPNHELWRTDGTTAGTWLVKDIHPTSGASPHWFAAINGGPRFVFGATAGGLYGGRELYVSDGTGAGTTLLMDINPGKYPSEPAWMTPLGGKVYFNASDGKTSYELWETDGTKAGTKRVTDHFVDASAGLGPRYIAALGTKLYFNVEAKGTKSSGVELYAYDTVSGLVTLVADLGPGALGSYPDYLTPVGSKSLYFAAHSAFGVELFHYDAVKKLTTLVADLNTGSSSSGPSAAGTRGRAGAPERRYAVTRGGKIFFFAEDGTHGAELHVLENGATATAVGLGCGTSGRRPTLAATDPRVGKTMTISGTGAYTGGSAFGYVLLGFGLSTPIEFAGGCELWLDLTKPAMLVAAFKVTTSTWSTTFDVPDVAALDGVSFTLQAYFAPTDAPRGFDVTNAVIAKVGK